jgi:biuret amidohydrolase
VARFAAGRQDPSEALTMPIDLNALLDPAHSAVVTMELQRGVVGDRSQLRELADEVAAQRVVENTARLMKAARGAGARVVHCTAEFRADGAGSVVNSPLLAAIARRGQNMVLGSEDVQLVPELGVEPSDIICARGHGLTPFPGTNLDATLRNMGVQTVVACGASVNVGVLGLVMGAVDLGYQAVVPTDAVAGIPREYADAVLGNTIAVLATRVTTDQVLELWKA